jgi:hypothetical protein
VSFVQAGDDAAATTSADHKTVNKKMNAAEWDAFRSEHMNKVVKAPGEAGEKRYFPGCKVCATTLTPTPGYYAAGYTEVYDCMVIEAWGAASPSAAGHALVRSDTIVQNGVCEHDHVKSLICEPVKE